MLLEWSKDPQDLKLRKQRNWMNVILQVEMQNANSTCALVNQRSGLHKILKFSVLLFELDQYTLTWGQFLQTYSNKEGKD